jgi:hypothetical protein
MEFVRAAAGDALDANQQVMQDEEIARMTTFARTGNPSAQGFAVWQALIPRRTSRTGPGLGPAPSIATGEPGS